MPYKDTGKRKENQKVYRKKQNELGLCVSCRKKALPGKTMCANHLLDSALKSKKYYYKNIEKIKKRVAERKRVKMEENSPHPHHPSHL